MVPLRMVVAAVGAALVVAIAPGFALSALAAPAVGDGPGEVSWGTATESASVGSGRVFPVRGPTSYAAAHHDYPAADVFADCGTPVVAPVTGTVQEVSRVDRWQPSTDDPQSRGGKSFSIVGLSGVRYYGSHLRSLAGRMQPGAAVEAGDPIGRVGNSGDAEYVPCHLHFGLSPKCRDRGDDWWIRRGVVSPYRFLQSWQHGGDLDPSHAVHHWLRHNGCQRSDVFG